MRLFYTCDCGLIVGYKKNCGYFNCPGCLMWLGSFEYLDGHECVDVIGGASPAHAIRDSKYWKGAVYAR